MSIGPFEILIVLFVLMLIVGPRRVTNMAKSLGRGVQDFVNELGAKDSGDSRRSAIGKDDAEEKDRTPSKTPDER